MSFQATGRARLTNARWYRLTLVNGRRLKTATILMMAVLFLAAGRGTHVPPSISTFVRSYQAVKNTNAPMSFWERVVYSLALSRQSAA
jgi:hypothetical protein